MRLLCQVWEETERGWGTRPDGYSLHVSHEALEAYVKAYWNGMPDYVPNEYSRPYGLPYWVEIELPIDSATIDHLIPALEFDSGYRSYDRNVPKPER